MHGIVCIDKPKDWTSFDVVNALSKKYRVKAGHTGTLDPQATGVLVCLINSTKVLPFLDMSKKRYIATCQLGIKTDTGDIWGNIIEEKKSQPIDKDKLKTILTGLLGKSQQEVPMTSAKKVRGKKLYEYQRQQLDVETITQEIEVFEIHTHQVDEFSFVFEALVSSGTYMRSLCETIAKKLGQIGTMSDLIRSECGIFTLQDCVSIDEALGSLPLIPIEKGLTHYQSVEVSNPKEIIHGKRFEHEYIDDMILLTHQQKALAIYEYDDKQKNYRSKRGLWI